MPSATATPHPTHARRLARSATLKVATLGMLSLALLVPAVFVRALIHEREARQTAVRTQIASTWSGPQILSGPMLTLTYARRAGERQRPQVRRRHVLPLDTVWEVTLEPERRRRGLYEAVLYRARLQAEGSFPPIPMEIDGYQLSGAVLGFGLSEGRGIEAGAKLEVGGRSSDLEPGAAPVGQAAVFGQAVHSVIGPELLRGGALPFRLDLDLRGSERLLFQATARETTLQVVSSWSAPGFVGARLPDRHEIGSGGFSATWQAPHFTRALPGAWWEGEVDVAELPQGAMGVELVLEADGYQRTERAVKYALLFIVTTFALFFMFEVLGEQRIHPVQYLLIGAALCVFYLLLLSLTEQLGFGVSYAAAATATTLLIGGYTRAALRSWLRALYGIATLTVLYGYLYVVLRAEDYALLLGSVGLFLVLCLVMYLTRGLDWYTTSSASLTGEDPAWQTDPP